MSVFSNGRKVYYGDAYMSAVEAEYENVTGKDSFWDDVNELYGLSREILIASQIIMNFLISSTSFL